MRISYDWLKDYVDVKMAPDRLAEILTMAGLPVESIERRAGDHILEIEVTANRPDWLSYIGVAREIAALTGGKLKMPRLARSSLARSLLKPGRAKLEAQSKKSISIKVDDEKLCPRYTARIIRNVKIEESPAWLKKRIEAMGLKSVNNIVDITNFCLFETGEPMHAFDLDKIKGGVFVRRARKGEKIKTIDGVGRALDDSVLVIADASRPIAIAGIMGGLETEVGPGTKDVLLEAASFDPVTTRRASRKLGISTESSYRFERKVDASNIAYSSDRAASLITELAGGKAGELVDIGGEPERKKALTISAARTSGMLGAEITAPAAKRILNALGLKMKSSSKGALSFEPPSFRGDLKSEIDLVEEVARIHGYGRIPSTVPPIVEAGERMPREFVCESRIRDLLAGAGMNEIMTYSLVGKGDLDRAALPQENVVEIANPLTSEQAFMRPSLIPGILNTVLRNINRKTKDLALFELGRVYSREGEDKFLETTHLSLAMAGERHNWAEGARPVTLFDLKGVVEALFVGLGIRDISFRQESSPRPSAAATVEVGGVKIGVLGEADPRILRNFDIKERVYLAEVSLDEIFRRARLEKAFEELPKHPAVSRDISIVVDEKTPCAEIVSAILGAAPGILREAALADRYVGKQIPDGKVGLTYRLEYRDPNRTLEEKDVSTHQARILRSLEEKFGAKLR